MLTCSGALACCAAGSGEHGLAAQLFGATDTAAPKRGRRIHFGLAPALEQATDRRRRRWDRQASASQFAAGDTDRRTASRLALRETAPAGAAFGHGELRALLRQRRPRSRNWSPEGLTNKEIGSRLFISERTVESHVRTILNTLGFTSRAQIAGWVASGD